MTNELVAGDPMIVEPLRISDDRLEMKDSLQESLRIILTRVQKSGEIPSRVVLTSALSGEGVTSISLALAVTLASDFQAKVGLIDLNWYSAAKWFLDREKTMGVIDILDGGIPFKNALQVTGLTNLSILPAGELEPIRRPMIARGKALRDLILKLEKQFDHLVLDVPAILSTSDAVPLASLGEGCILVLQQGATPTAEVRQALSEISHLPLLGIVLNQVRYSTPGFLISLLEQ